MINVIGLGYIGLPTALMLCASGLEITGTDYNIGLVHKLNRRDVSFTEDGMESLFERAIENGIKFTKEYVQAQYYIIAVPTPYSNHSKKIDVRYLIDAVRNVVKVCRRNSIIIIESTVSPGTIDKHIRPLVAQYGFIAGRDIHLVHAPERIMPGNTLNELRNNDRTLGVDDKEIGEKVKKIYSYICEGEITITSIRTAEMTKVVENAYRDINIAYANELAKICRSDNMDVYEIIEIANKHPRVNILSPGPGVGGHCISVDPWFLVGDYPELTNIIQVARKINESMPEFVLERLHSIMKKTGISDLSRIGFYGLTYKENVADTRESPSLQLLKVMEKHFSSGFVQTYDPYINDNISENQHYDFNEFLDSIDLVVILVGHKELIQNIEKLKDKVIFDTRNVCELEGTYRL